MHSPGKDDRLTAAKELEIRVSSADKPGRVRVHVKFLSVPDLPDFIDNCDPCSGPSRDALIQRATKARTPLQSQEVRVQLEHELTNAAAKILEKQSDDPTGSSKRHLRDQIVEFIRGSEIELFSSDVTGRRQGYLSRVVDGVRVTYSLDSEQAQHIVRAISADEFKQAIPAQSVRDVIGTLEMEASRSKLRRAVGLRVLEFEGTTLLDLCDDEGKLVRIASDGWKIISAADVDVRFLRCAGMQALPVPVRGGSLDELRKLLNIKSKDDWLLLVGVITDAYRPATAFPTLMITGQAGSGKSTATRLIRGLLDPNSTPLRRAPEKSVDVYLAACNGWTPCLENVSRLSRELKDALCSLATGGGFSVRLLYTNGAEFLAKAKRLMILNGISNVLTRGDLASRAVVIELPVIKGKQRRTEDELFSEFALGLPRMLGAVLDLVARAKSREKLIAQLELPRLADFALWGEAVAAALGLPFGSFVAALDRNQTQAQVETVACDPIGAAVLRLLERQTLWRGSPTELHKLLADQRPGRAKSGDSDWPASVARFSRCLSDLEPSLQAIGIDVQREKGLGSARPRLITLARTAEFQGSALRESDERSTSSSSTESAVSDGRDGSTTPFLSRETPPLMEEEEGDAPYGKGTGLPSLPSRTGPAAQCGGDVSDDDDENQGKEGGLHA